MATQQIRSEQILDGTIVDADISPTAAIAVTKLAGVQPIDAQLTALAALADAVGVLTNNGSGVLSWAAAGGGGTVTGTGTTGTLPKWTSSTALGNSVVTEATGVVSVAGRVVVAGSLTLNGPVLSAWNGSVATDGNLALGVEALTALASGGATNTAMGYRALRVATTAQGNVAVGANALSASAYGAHNTAVGASTLLSATSLAEDNTVMGWFTGATITAGVMNTIIGSSSGGGLTTGNYNTILGAQVAGLPAALSNNVILADGQGNQRLKFDANGAATVTGFGDHAFAATGTGRLSVTVRNLTAGTANDSVYFLGNNGSATLAYFRAFSTTYATSGPSIASGAQIVSEGAGGLSLCAVVASIGFYPGGTTLRGVMHASGGFSWGDAGDPGGPNFRVAGVTTLVGRAEMMASSYMANGFHLSLGSIYTGRTSVNPTNAINFYAGIAPAGTTAGAPFCTLYCKLVGAVYRLFYMDSGGTEIGPLSGPGGPV